MKNVTKFEPNGQLYLFLLAAFSLLSLIFYGLFSGLLSIICLFLLGSGLFTYLLWNQNKLELSSTEIHQSFLLPFRSDNNIVTDNIDWIALDNRVFSVLSFDLFHHARVIIKLKNDQILTINFALLKRKAEIKEFFQNLSNQMADHDKELFKLKDLHGFSHLAIDATLGLTDLVEAMHQNVARLPGSATSKTENSSPGITGSIYKSIRAITGFTGEGIDGLLEQISPLLSKTTSETQNISDKQKKVSFERAALLSALNGVLGDYMVTSNNTMTIPMRFRRNGHSLKLSTDALTESIQPISSKLLILVHGLCMNDLQWQRKGHDHGASLSSDLGYTPIYLRYNTGQHISKNGRAFSELLDVLVKLWPVPIEELVILGHSMGGLVSRSAYHYAEKNEHAWLIKIRKMIFLGSPHHGAPLERGGNWIDTILGATPYTEPLARLGKVRSSGITDLRYGNIIDEHWQGRDRFERSEDKRLPVPLPKTVQCFTIAGTTGNKVGDVIDQVLGDGLVQVKSALGQHKDPALSLDISAEQQWVAYGVNHMDLLNNPEVYGKIKQWLS